MIEDAQKIPAATTLRCDICIVGAGAAGISLAMEFAKTNRDVLLIEAGGTRGSGKSKLLYQGSVNDPNRHLRPDQGRHRQIGGTSKIWGGRCIPFDGIDFEQRDYVPFSGWPIERRELAPYYERAHAYAACGAFDYASATGLGNSGLAMIEGFSDPQVLTDTIERWSPPVHFGKRYLPDLKQSQNIRVLVNAVATDIESTNAGDHVARLTVSTFRDNAVHVEPRVLVLAGGGLETARLLLASNRRHGTSLGDQAGWLGRGFMSHVHGVVSTIAFSEGRDVVFGYEQDAEGVYCRRRFTISEATQRERKILNMYALLERPLVGDPSHGNAMLSLTFLVKRIAQRYRNAPLGTNTYALYWAHFWNILAGSPEVVSFLPQFFRKRFLQQRRVPSLLTRAKSNKYHLYFFSEQVPDRSNRITLNDRCDPLGVPTIHVDYKINEPDVESIVRAHELIDEALRRGGCGQLSFSGDDPRELVRNCRAAAGHHIGTTRMSGDPGGGVVDADCRVHGVDNLFVASSSVFPTASQANPTLTILAMALRLADRLKRL